MKRLRCLMGHHDSSWFVGSYSPWGEWAAKRCIRCGHVSMTRTLRHSRWSFIDEMLP